MNVDKCGDEEYLVESESHPDMNYKVSYKEGTYNCNCPAFIYRNKGMGCKHIDAVRLEVKDRELNEVHNDKELVRANVNWVSSQWNRVLVPLIPLGWEWTNDYIYFIMTDLVALNYSKKQIQEFFGENFKGMLDNISLTEIVKYCEELGDDRRNFIELQIEKMVDVVKEGVK